MSTHRNGFWRDAFALQGSITPHVMQYVFSFGVISAIVCAVAWYVERTFAVRISLEVAPYEIAGAVLGLLLVLRTNAGYDRWWEARILWGGIVNQSRNLGISALAYGPENSQWRTQIIYWAAVYPHIARNSLRDERPGPEVTALLGDEQAARLAASNHMPGFVALKLAELLQEACEKFEMDRFAFMQIDQQRAQLIDHIGACERILKTPLPMLYSIKIRRFIALFMLTLPFALLHHVGSIWLIPFICMFVAYPLVSLDQIGIELQNPFTEANLSHLPLKDISATIEQNLLAVLELKQNGTEDI